MSNTEVEDSKLAKVKSYVTDRSNRVDVSTLVSYFHETNGSVTTDNDVTYKGKDALEKYFTENPAPAIRPSVSEPTLNTDGNVLVKLTFVALKKYDITFSFTDDNEYFTDVVIKTSKSSWI